MRYTLFFTYSLFPFPSYLLPAPCSLLPAPCSLKTINLYLTSCRIAISTTYLLDPSRDVFDPRIKNSNRNCNIFRYSCCSFC
ncbi:hypothetical protein, partial [Moorena sp. SIO4A5]|uniref:hypothetical protein n=1 Tax=Moorena sp. SIO4A5 TaxID=2607838 RepID=UPI0013C59F49